MTALQATKSAAQHGYSGWVPCGRAGFHVDLRTRALDLSRQDIQTVLARLDASLDRVTPDITHVRVRLADVNGPKGGEDKRCTVRIQLGRLGTVQVTRCAPTIWEALSRALATAKRGCHERLEVRQTRRRRRRRTSNQWMPATR